MRLRKRVHVVPPNSRVGYIHYTADTVSSTVESRYIPSHTEISHMIQDENHWSCYPNCGGNLLICKKTFEYGKIGILNGYDTFYPGYRRTSYDSGGFVLPRDNFTALASVAASGVGNNTLAASDDPIDFNSTADSVSDAGNAGFKRFRPKLERVNFIESLSELPSTVKSLSLRAFSAQKKANRYGDAYVQSSFLWLPLVRDLVGFFDICVNTERRIGDLVRANGKWLRRGGLLSVTSENSSKDVPRSTSLYRPAIGQCIMAKHIVELSTRERFIGMFRYYVPGISRRKYLGRLMALNVLCGTRLTPSNVYNALPWSWLVDWTTGAGDWVSNYSSRTADDCACKYAYVMRDITAKSSLSVTVRGSFQKFNVPAVPTFASGTSVVTLEKKVRSGVTQNFSFSGGPLSDKQALILHSLMKGAL